MGERLPEGVDVTYRMEGQQPAYGQLEVTPITLLTSPPVYQRGSLIAVNHNYICYVVKGNMIRVINILSAKRALLRGHTKGITDLRFCGGGDDILASAGADGRLLVWRITEEASSGASSTPSDEEAGIGHELVAAVRMEGDRWSERVIWHPTHAHVLATVGNDQHAYVWDLNRIRHLKHITEDGKNVFVYSGTEPVDGVIRINVGAPINDLAFAPRGNALATASSDGRVQIWSAGGGAVPSSPSLSWLAHGTGAWGVLYHRNGKVLITGGQHNAELGVWQLNEEDEDAEPVLLQKIKFAPPPSGAIFNHIVLEPSGQYLFVANAKSSTFVVLHLQTQPQPRFDYATEFSVAQAILSFTVINRGVAKPELEMDLYCLQTKAIQMYHVTSSLCYTPPPADTPPAPAAQPSTPTTTALPVAATPPGSGGSPAVPTVVTAPAADSEPSPSPPTSTGRTSAPSPARSPEPSRPKSPPGLTVTEVAAADRAPAETEPKETAEAEVGRATEELGHGFGGQDTAAAVAQPTEPLKSETEQRPASPPAEAAPSPAPSQEQSAVVSTEPSEPTPSVEENGHAAELAATDIEATAKAAEPEAPHPEEGETGVTAPGASEEKEREKFTLEREEEPSKPSPSIAEETAAATERAEAAPETKEEAEEAATEPTNAATPQVEDQHRVQELKEEAIAPFTPPTATTEGEVPQPRVPGEPAQAAPSPALIKPLAGSPSGRGKQPKKPKSAKSEGRTFSVVSPHTANQAASANVPLPVRSAEAEPALPVEQPGQATLAAMGNLPSDLKRLEVSLINSLSARMERSLQQHADRQVAKAEKERQERDKAERERHQRLLAALTQALSTGLAGIPQQVEKAVQKELQMSLVPAFGRVLATLEKALIKGLVDDLRPLLAQGQTNGTWQQDLPPRLASEVASRLPSANDIVTALQGSVRHALESSFRSSFQETIIPSFQGSCQAMFQQIYGTVLPGLQQTIEEAVEPGLDRLASGDLRETLQSLTNAVNDLRELSARNAELFQTLSQTPSGARIGMQPPSGLPEQHVTEAQLLQLLERDAYEQAFACALSERGAEAVRHLLQWIEPQGFFESGHGLSQIVTASLIHRVALDLHHDTPIKLDWLSHLLLHFHPSDTSIAAHSQHILHHTTHHLNMLLTAHPHQPLAINIKLLLHTANSLLSAPPPSTPSGSFSSLPYGLGTPYL